MSPCTFPTACTTPAVVLAIWDEGNGEMDSIALCPAHIAPFVTANLPSLEDGCDIHFEAV